MRMLFKQRLFSWLDSYDIYDDQGNVLYTVQGQLAWGHKLKVFDAQGRELGMLRERMLVLLPKFEIYLNGQYAGCVSREFSFFRPRYQIDYLGWQVEGDFWGWDYSIQDPAGSTVATVSKELLHWTDTYAIDVARPADALAVLMFVLAIDAEKCSGSS